MFGITCSRNPNLKFLVRRPNFRIERNICNTCFWGKFVKEIGKNVVLTMKGDITDR